MTQYCVPQAHFVSGHSGIKGGIDLTGAFASQCSCSTSAMLSLLAWWSTHSKYEDMVKCSLAILEGFARRLPTKVALPIEFVQERGEGGPMLVTYEAEVEGGILGPCAELQSLARHSLRALPVTRRWPWETMGDTPDLEPHISRS